jgi:hypothetical protein
MTSLIWNDGESEETLFTFLLQILPNNLHTDSTTGMNHPV